MNKTAMVGSMVMAGVLLAGCATSGGPKETDLLKSRIDMLEGQVNTLNQRVDEMGQPASSGSSALFNSGSDSRRSSSSKSKLSTRQVQKALAAAGYYQGNVDGKEGPQTKKAIKAFQQANGLKADGVVGAATSEALSKYLE